MKQLSEAEKIANYYLDKDKKDDKGLEKSGEKYALIQDMLGNIDIGKNIPEFVKTPEYTAVITWLCTKESDRCGLVELADRLGKHRNSLYYWMKHDTTKVIIDNYIQSLNNKKRLDLYDSQSEVAKTNPHMARFVAERYDNYTPKSNNNVPITINIGFVSEGKIEDAQVIEDGVLPPEDVDTD
jgi:hypothetical protein